MTEWLTPIRAPLPGAIAVEARIHPGVSVVGRIITSPELRVEAMPDGTINIAAVNAQVCWFAFYPDLLLGRRKAPYDHIGASYLPLPWSALHASAIEGFGALLVQQTPFCGGGVDITARNDGVFTIARQLNDVTTLRDLLRELGRKAGVPLARFISAA